MKKEHKNTPRSAFYGLPGALKGPWCKEDLNRLMPWIDKIWALHPYFPELMGKERTLQGVELKK